MSGKSKWPVSKKPFHFAAFTADRVKVEIYDIFILLNFAYNRDRIVRYEQFPFGNKILGGLPYLGHRLLKVYVTSTRAKKYGCEYFIITCLCG